MCVPLPRRLRPSRVRSPVAVSAVSRLYFTLWASIYFYTTTARRRPREVYLLVFVNHLLPQANAVNGGSDEVVEVKEFMVTQGYRVEVSRYLSI